MNIYTHINPNLDSSCAVWAAIRFHPNGGRARLRFVPQSWDGLQMESEDLAIGLDAGGRGIRSARDEEGAVRSAFDAVLYEYADEDVYSVLAPILEFVDIQSEHGSVYKHMFPNADPEDINVLATTGMNAIFRALQGSVPKHLRGNGLSAPEMEAYETTVRNWLRVMDGILRSRMSRRLAEREADTAQMVGNKVAIVRNARSMATSGILFERGCRVIVYADGNNLGLTRHADETMRVDHKVIRELVTAQKEEAEWFAHPSGSLYCRGSRRSQANTPSRVDPVHLAQRAAQLLG